MSERSIYPGFTESTDLREVQYDTLGELLDKRQYPVARQLQQDATEDHRAKHTIYRHPWCSDCEGAALREQRAPVADPEAIGDTYEALLSKGVPSHLLDQMSSQMKRLDRANVQKTLERLPEELREETRQFLADEYRHDKVEEDALYIPRARAVRYLLLHRNPPEDTYDPDADGGLAAEVLDRGQIDDLPTPDPLIRGVLNRHSYAVLRGRDGTYKTFVALDWSLSLAAGRAWQGRAAEQVRVLYIAGEGAYGLATRIAAWEHHTGTKVDPDWFHVLPRAVNLYKGPEFASLAQVVQDGGYGLVVVDTLRRAAGGADGNSSDMGVVVDRLDRLKRATTDGSVLVIAHTDKGDNDTRGYSGIEDDADIVWHCKLEDDQENVGLKNTKMKDGPDGDFFPLFARPVKDSIVLEACSSRPEPEVDSTASETALLFVMQRTFSETGASSAELFEACGLPKSTYYYARNRLLQSNRLRNVGTSSRPRYELPGTPVQRPETPSEQGLSNQSNAVQALSNPVQSSPTPLKGLDVGQPDCHEQQEIAI